MYLAIGKWQKSGLTQHEFSKGEKLAKATFSYWLKKYRQGDCAINTKLVHLC